MSKRNTMRINAPKDIVQQWRQRFPGVYDPQMIRVMWNSANFWRDSVIKLEAEFVRKRKK